MDKVDDLLIFVKEKQRRAKTSANNTKRPSIMASLQSS